MTGDLERKLLDYGKRFYDDKTSRLGYC